MRENNDKNNNHNKFEQQQNKQFKPRNKYDSV